MTAKTTKKTKMYIDHKGNEIPSGFIFKTDREKHSAALRYSKKAEKLSKQLADLKKEVLMACDELYQKTLDENRVILRKNSKGSYTISTVDKEIKIEVTVQESMAFNDNISIAQQVIKEYLAEKTEGADAELSQLVNHAFETSRGKLDVRRIMGLMKLNIKHPKWEQAIGLIRQSIETTNSKRYVRFFKKDENGGYNAIPLDFASL